MVGSGSAAYGQGWDMDAIAACVVGGVSVSYTHLDVYKRQAMDTANALARSLETAHGELTPVDIATVKNM